MYGVQRLFGLLTLYILHAGGYAAKATVMGMVTEFLRQESALDPDRRRCEIMPSETR